MSSRDSSVYGDAAHTDPWSASQHPESGAADQARSAADDAMGTAQQKGQEAVGTAKQKAGEAAHMAHERADQGMHKAAEGMDQAAEMLRQRGNEQGGTMGSVATSAADTLDSASQYLRDKDTDQLLDDLEAYIRKNPTQSLLIAAGVGFVLSKVFK